MKVLLDWTYEIGWRLAFVLCVGMHVATWITAWACVIIAIYGLHAATVELDEQSKTWATVRSMTKAFVETDRVAIVEHCHVIRPDPAGRPLETPYLIWWDSYGDCCTTMADESFIVYPSGLHAVGWLGYDERYVPHRDSGWWVSSWWNDTTGRQDRIAASNKIERWLGYDPEREDQNTWPVSCRRKLKATIQGQPGL